MSQSILTRPLLPADSRISYGPDPFQFADLRIPDGAGPHPCVVAIHGGFWQSAYDLNHLSHLCGAITSSGIATWSLEYRRIGNPGGGWPSTFLDVARGVRHVFEIGAEYNIDPNRVTVLGHSAGGQLAFWLAGIGKSTMWSQFQVDTFPLRAAISLAGVLDMRKASELGVGSGSIERLMGGTPDRLRERYANVSPIELLPFDLPHLAIHGVNDGLVPLSMSEGFHQVAGELNSNSSLLTLPGVGHFELIDPRSEIFGQVTSAVVALTA